MDSVFSRLKLNRGVRGLSHSKVKSQQVWMKTQGLDQMEEVEQLT